MDNEWLVILGELNWLNGPSEVVMPTREAAIRFAKGNCEDRGAKVLNPDLEVIRRYNGVGQRVDKDGNLLRRT